MNNEHIVFNVSCIEGFEIEMRLGPIVIPRLFQEETDHINCVIWHNCRRSIILISIRETVEPIPNE